MAVAQEAGVPCTAVWLDAKTSLLPRLASRSVSPSDADLEVLSRQLAAEGITWQPVDADRDANEIARAILEIQSDS
ncbi:hypothetical protein [Sinorhizobium fredii]|uniref:hypothetical protein n=1 Tax=Rhizobium fredii TaxID=380 RepID=UPI0035144817